MEYPREGNRPALVLMTYVEALQYLRDLEPRGWRLGLDRMREFAIRAGLGSFLGGVSGPKFVHVAGTNGKGSVTAFAEAMLLHSGKSTGAFFSPYVVDPRERVWFGGQMISEAEFIESVLRLAPVAQAMDDTEFGGVTEFEMKTAIGLDHWARNNAEFVALEVGLGGRFDSTNIVTPEVSVIVSIGLDHMNILGDTVEKIAFEKAGIVKPGIPVIIGQMAPGPEQVIVEVARQAKSPMWRFGTDLHLTAVDDGVWKLVTPHSEVILRPSLFGEVQGHNAALAYAALEAAGVAGGQDRADGVQNARLPGRFQLESYRGRRLVLDGAHNSASGTVLRSALELHRRQAPFERAILVAGMVGGHEPLPFFENFEGMVGEIHLAPIDFHRAVTPEQLKGAIEHRFGCVKAHESLAGAIDQAVQEAGPSDIVVVSGSFYLVGEAIRLLRGTSAN